LFSTDNFQTRIHTDFTIFLYCHKKAQKGNQTRGYAGGKSPLEPTAIADTMQFKKKEEFWQDENLHNSCSQFFLLRLLKHWRREHGKYKTEDICVRPYAI
jgi:hypothetical protein